MVKIQICWKSDQGNKKDIQKHKQKSSVHSKQHPTKNAAKQEEDDECKQNGIHELKYNQCNEVYIGQTGRNFKARCKEKIYILHKKDNSKYAKHILDTQYEYSTADDTLDLLKMTSKLMWVPGNNNTCTDLIRKDYPLKNNIQIKITYFSNFH